MRWRRRSWTRCPGPDPIELVGDAEEFEWLPEAIELGWRRERHVVPATGRDGLARASAGSTVIVARRLAGSGPRATGGERARLAIRALAVGYGLVATIEEPDLAGVLERLGRPPVNTDEDERSRLGIVLALGEVGRWARVLAAHYVRPVARDQHGHVQRLPPAVLATWNMTTDAFDHFAWGVLPELADRIGRRPVELEREQARLAAELRASGVRPTPRRSRPGRRPQVIEHPGDAQLGADEDGVAPASVPRLSMTRPIDACARTMTSTSPMTDRIAVRTSSSWRSGSRAWSAAKAPSASRGTRSIASPCASARARTRAVVGSSADGSVATTAMRRPSSTARSAIATCSAPAASLPGGDRLGRAAHRRAGHDDEVRAFLQGRPHPARETLLRARRTAPASIASASSDSSVMGGFQIRVEVVGEPPNVGGRDATVWMNVSAVIGGPPWSDGLGRQRRRRFASRAPPAGARRRRAGAPRRRAASEAVQIARPARKPEAPPLQAAAAASSKASGATPLDRTTHGQGVAAVIDRLAFTIVAVSAVPWVGTSAL